MITVALAIILGAPPPIGTVLLILSIQEWQEQKEAANTFYIGPIKNNLPDGEGKITYADGDIYEGELRKGSPEGQGKMTYADGRIYEGEWYGGFRDGQGKMLFADGRIYEGEWKEGKFQG